MHLLGSFARGVQLYADFERDCLELAMILPYPLERIKAAVREVASQSFRPNHTMPKHLYSLIMAKWGVEQRDLCNEGCLEKFYALLETEGQENKET